MREYRDNYRKHGNTRRINVYATKFTEIHLPLSHEIGRQLFDVQTEKIIDLGREDNDGYTRREANDQRIGDEFQIIAEPSQTKADQYDARHDGRNNQPIHTMFTYNPKNDDDKSAGGPADLHAATAKDRYGKTRHHSGDQSLFGRHPRGDGKGNGQRQRNDADNDPGKYILDDYPLGNAIFEQGEKLRYEFVFHESDKEMVNKSKGIEPLSNMPPVFTTDLLRFLRGDENPLKVQYPVYHCTYRI